MSYKLEKPYTETQKIEFIVTYNHNKGLTLEETEIALYALEANEIMQAGEPIINPKYEQEQATKEAERISMLNLTAADVERGIYKAKGMDFEDILSQVQTLKQVQGDSFDIDVKALKIELKANNFYRGNPYVDVVGELLGFTSKQLDEFFETNDYTKLLSDVENL